MTWIVFLREREPAQLVTRLEGSKPPNMKNGPAVSILPLSADGRNDRSIPGSLKGCPYNFLLEEIKNHPTCRDRAGPCPHRYGENTRISVILSEAKDPIVPNVVELLLLDHVQLTRILHVLTASSAFRMTRTRRGQGSFLSRKIKNKEAALLGQPLRVNAPFY
jgi:hypothetical protein